MEVLPTSPDAVDLHMQQPNAGSHVALKSHIRLRWLDATSVVVVLQTSTQGA